MTVHCRIILNKVIDTGYDDTQWALTNSRTGKSSGSLKLILHYAASARTVSLQPLFALLHAPPLDFDSISASLS